MEQSSIDLSFFVSVSWQPAGPFLRERSVRGFEVFEFLHARKGVRFAHA